MLHLWPQLHREPGPFVWSGGSIPELALRMGCAFLLSLERKACPGIRLQNGMPFPVERLAESSSQNMAPERDALSETAFKRKLCPRIPSQNGTHFPKQPSSGKCVPESALGMGCAFRQPAVWKVHPSLSVYSGMQFPLGASTGKSVPFWASILGHSFRCACHLESVSQFGGQAGISSATSTAQHR